MGRGDSLEVDNVICSQYGADGVSHYEGSPLNFHHWGEAQSGDLPHKEDDPPVSQILSD